MLNPILQVRVEMKSNSEFLNRVLKANRRPQTIRKVSAFAFFFKNPGVRNYKQIGLHTISKELPSKNHPLNSVIATYPPSQETVTSFLALKINTID